MRALKANLGRFGTLRFTDEFLKKIEEISKKLKSFQQFVVF